MLYPGVTYHLRRVSYQNRLDFDGQMEEFRTKARELQNEYSDLDRDPQLAELRSLRPKPDEAGKTPEVAPEVASHIASLEETLRKPLARMDEIQLQSWQMVAKTYNPARLKWGLDRIEGLEINGTQASVEDIITKAPVEMFNEALAFIEEMAGLTDKKNSTLQSVGTSSEAGDGSEKNTTAEPASDAVTITSATA